MRLSTSKGVVLGIDLGGTKLASALFDFKGNVIYRATRKLEGRKGRAAGELVTGSLKDSIDFAESKDKKVYSIGISVPGISYKRRGTVWAPNIRGWDDYPLMKEIKELCGKAHVIIESDRACHILGEVWKGNAVGCKNAVFIAVGTGIGAGILVNGDILRGNNDISGAAGWMALERPFREQYISCGCFEYHASGEGIARVARDYLASDRSYKGVLSTMDPAQITSHEVINEFWKDDLIARKVIGEAVQYWGMAAANIISLLNPGKVIFGGGLFGPLKDLIPDIKAEATKWAQPIAVRQVIFDASALGSDAAIFGAGYMALKEINIHQP